MLTLADIDRLTNSHDGSIYSDLYKDVYGFRPRGQMAQFVSLHDFDRVYKTLSEILDEKIDEEKAQQAKNWNKFLARVFEVRDIVIQTTTEDAIYIIADAEGIATDELKFYGWEILEHELNLKYGSIKAYLAENGV